MLLIRISFYTRSKSGETEALLKGLIRWLVHIHYNSKAITKTEYSTLILNKRWIWTSHLMRLLGKVETGGRCLFCFRWVYFQISKIIKAMRKARFIEKSSAFKKYAFFWRFPCHFLKLKKKLFELVTSYICWVVPKKWPEYPYF